MQGVFTLLGSMQQVVWRTSKMTAPKMTTLAMIMEIEQQGLRAGPCFSDIISEVDGFARTAAKGAVAGPASLSLPSGLTATHSPLREKSVYTRGAW
jgi:hypothetical protein